MRKKAKTNQKPQQTKARGTKKQVSRASIAAHLGQEKVREIRRAFD